MAEAIPVNLILKVKLMPLNGGPSYLFTTNTIRQRANVDARERCVLNDFVDVIHPRLRAELKDVSAVKFHTGYPTGFPDNDGVALDTPPNAQSNAMPEVSANATI
jgi:hypothetical protein